MSLVASLYTLQNLVIGVSEPFSSEFYGNFSYIVCCTKCVPQTKTADLAHTQSFTRSLANLLRELFTSVTTHFSQLFVQYPGGGTKLVLMH